MKWGRIEIKIEWDEYVDEGEEREATYSQVISFVFIYLLTDEDL